MCSRWPGYRHRPTCTPRRRTLCVMTNRREKLRSAPPGPRHRLPRTGRLFRSLGLTRRGSEVRITDLAETLGYVLGYRNMKKLTLKKTKVLGTFSFILKKSLK